MRARKFYGLLALALLVLALTVWSSATVVIDAVVRIESRNGTVR